MLLGRTSGSVGRLGGVISGADRLLGNSGGLSEDEDGGEGVDEGMDKGTIRI